MTDKNTRIRHIFFDFNQLNWEMKCDKMRTDMLFYSSDLSYLPIFINKVGKNKFNNITITIYRYSFYVWLKNFLPFVFLQII